MKDSFECDDGTRITERIVTLIQPQVCNEKSCVTVGDACITFDGSVCDLVISEEKREAGDICYFIDFNLKDSVRSFEITVR